VIPAGEDFTVVTINPIDNDLSDGTRSVRLSLMLATKRPSDVYLPDEYRLTMAPRALPTRCLVTVTEFVSIPGLGGDRKPVPATNHLLQTYPT